MSVCLPACLPACLLARRHAWLVRCGWLAGGRVTALWKYYSVLGLGHFLYFFFFSFLTRSPIAFYHIWSRQAVGAIDPSVRNRDISKFYSPDARLFEQARAGIRLVRNPFSPIKRMTLLPPRPHRFRRNPLNCKRRAAGWNPASRCVRPLIGIGDSTIS